MEKLDRILLGLMIGLTMINIVLIFVGLFICIFGDGDLLPDKYNALGGVTKYERVPQAEIYYGGQGYKCLPAGESWSWVKHGGIYNYCPKGQR